MMAADIVPEVMDWSEIESSKKSDAAKTVFLSTSELSSFRTSYQH